MVTQEIHKEAVLVSDAALELLEHVEKLLRDVRIELAPEYFPARRAAALYDPIGTQGGQFITFQTYKAAIEDLEGGVDSIFGVKFDEDFGADEENNSFAAAVRQLKEGGMSTGDAIGAESGATGLDTLAEGIIPGFIKALKNIIPDLPGIDALGGDSGPLSDYMSAGMPDTNSVEALKYAAKDAVERAKGYVKSSAGIQNSARKEIESAPAKLVKTAVAIAINLSAEPSPARIWTAWAIYPELRSLYNESKEIASEPINTEGASVVSYQDNGRVINSLNTTMDRLKVLRTELREYAVLMTTCMSSTEVCCLIGILDRRKDVAATISMFKNIMQMGKSVNKLRTFETPDYTKAFDRMKSRIVGKMIRRFDERYHKMVKSLRDIFEDSGNECFSLDFLLDMLISVLNDVRARVIKMLRKYAADIQIQRRHQRIKTDILFKNLNIAEGARVLDQVEAQINFIDRCKLDDDMRIKRLIRIAEEFQCTPTGFTFHRRGQPLPAGVDPDYPLLNLDPVQVAHFQVAPGIQGQEIPTGRFEELFKACKSGRLDKFDFTEVAPAQIKRR